MSPPATCPTRLAASAGALIALSTLLGCQGASGPAPLLPAELDPAGLAQVMNDGLPLELLDVRLAEQYAISHITGSDSRPLPSLAAWAPGLDPTSRIVCVGATGADGQTAAEGLIAVGCVQVSWLSAGMAAWDGPVDSLRQDISTGQLQDMLDAAVSLQLCDVRTAAEYAAGHIPAAVNLPYDQVATWASTLVKQQPVVCICASGNRSRIAADALVARDFHAVYNVLGGMNAWGGSVVR